MTTEKTEIDYDSMSLEDLERELDKIDQPTPEIQENNIETEEIQTEKEEPETSKVIENEEDALYNDPFYRPFKEKSKTDMLKILRDNATYVSQKDNENYKLKTELETLKTRVQETPKMDDELKEYDQKDVEVIKKLVKTQLEEERQQELRQAESRLLSIRQQNETMFESLKSSDPEFAETIKTDLIEAIKKDMGSTLNQENWVLNYYIQAKNKVVNTQVKNKDNLVSKKLSASTVTGNGNVGVTQTFNPNTLSPDEWYDWAIKNPDKTIKR